MIEPPPLPHTISGRQFRSAAWRPVYYYKGVTSEFTTFGCTIDGADDLLEGVTMTHDRRRHGRLRIYYMVYGRTTDSPTQAVRYYNEEIKARLNGGRRKTPGSVETITRAKP